MRSGINVRGLPDARRADLADDGSSIHPPDKEQNVSLIQVKVIDGVLTAPQKQEIVERLTDAMVAITGESMRQYTCCLLEEVASGQWGIGGQTLTADDVRALARAETGAGPDAR
jgi:4-oxalocrotonate tautomerase